MSLNTKDIMYLAYYAHLKEKIDRVWDYPSDAVTRQILGHLLLLFVLERSGQVTMVELLRSSGSTVLDRAAWEAVMKASPFDPFPPHIWQEALRIRARFKYVLEAGRHRRTIP